MWLVSGGVWEGRGGRDKGKGDGEGEEGEGRGGGGGWRRREGERLKVDGGVYDYIYHMLVLIASTCEHI